MQVAQKQNHHEKGFTPEQVALLQQIANDYEHGNGKTYTIEEVCASLDKIKGKFLSGKL